MNIRQKIFTTSKVIIFIFILFHLYVQFTYISRKPIAHTTGNLTGFYALKRNSLDVCFIGTSGTFSAFCPMQAWQDFGFASYNFCINVMGADTMIYAVKEVRKSQKKAIMVIDIYPFIIHHLVSEENGMKEYAIRYNTDGYRYSLNRFNLIRKCLPKTENSIPYYFDLLKYHSSDLNFSRLNFSTHSVTKGYNNMVWGNSEPAILTNEIKPLEEEFDKALDELIEYCKTIKENVLFIYYPYGNVREDSIAYVNYIQQKISKDFSFINCEDFVDDFDFDYSLDFWNVAHWNIFGAEKITKLISEKLKNIYNFPDKRENKTYASWNEDILEWEKYVKSSKASVLEQRNSSGNL